MPGILDAIEAAIKAVRGGIAAIRVPRLEERHEKLVTEFVEEDRKRVERLVAKCGSCGQPVRGRRVIRFTNDELRRWQALDRAEGRLCRLGGLGMALSVLVVVGLMVWVLVQSRDFFNAVIAGLLGGGGLMAYVMWRQHRAFKEQDEHRTEILRRHGDMKPRQVGLGGGGYQPYVILTAS